MGFICNGWTCGTFPPWRHAGRGSGRRCGAASPESGLWDGGGTITIGTSSAEPRRQDLDDIAPANPVMMVRACGHSQWVNSQALTAANITRDTPDPRAGRSTATLAAGSPPGCCGSFDTSSSGSCPFPAWRPGSRPSCWRRRMRCDWGSPGCTPAKDSSNGKPSRRWTEPGPSRCGCITCLPPDDLDDAAASGVRPAHGSERLWAGHVKLYADGSLGAGTALLPRAVHG